MTKSILSYLFSLIGFVPINELQTLQQQQQKRITSKNEEESCQYLTSSTFVLEEEENFNEKTTTNNNDNMNWLYNLSKMTLCQILSTTIHDYPQVADGIYNRHYYHNYKKKNNNNCVKELQWIQLQANRIVHSLDNLRPSEQFGRSSEIGNLLYELLLVIQQKSRHYNSSFISLFGLIILSQEALNCPTEVRQYIFTDIKFGRSIILEISNVLKNFKNQYNMNDINNQWSLLNTMSWFDALELICTKLSRYDITWEYRKEYQDVVVISEKYYK